MCSLCLLTNAALAHQSRLSQTNLDGLISAADQVKYEDWETVRNLLLESANLAFRHKPLLATRITAFLDGWPVHLPAAREVNGDAERCTHHARLEALNACSVTELDAA